MLNRVSSFSRRKLLSAIALSTLMLSSAVFTPNAIAAATGLYDRSAQGDVTQFGGARRLTGDQTQALRDSLSNKTVKNIILLIGDGMGDSEITSARNYAMGAGGFFKGIDALPLTGQYTHYSLDKRHKNRITSLTQRRLLPHGHQA